MNLMNYLKCLVYGLEVVFTARNVYSETIKQYVENQKKRY